jgi:intracellular multiplication protein IcmT
VKGYVILKGFWRDTGRQLKLFIFNAYVAVPLLLFLLHIRWWTLFLLLMTVAGMAYIERKGFTVPVALLALRAWIAGRVVKRRRSFFAKQLNR